MDLCYQMQAWMCSSMVLRIGHPCFRTLQLPFLLKTLSGPMQTHGFFSIRAMIVLIFGLAVMDM
ncbi:hypothetical protein K814_0120110 [Pseudomonas fluorescens LMG 5329]|uniref:Uncharacterized protein n=1 Tax=Pseudomonas fluorescens LMG 5329 TaxID=1324332 RepID=A0A0A1YZ17_PSEFL|nr:hypothetical protein K814_0120110 [Pseudomonas fluorescens LMG 5329]